MRVHFFFSVSRIIYNVGAKRGSRHKGKLKVVLGKVTSKSGNIRNLLTFNVFNTCAA